LKPGISVRCACRTDSSIHPQGWVPIETG